MRIVKGVFTGLIGYTMLDYGYRTIVWADQIKYSNHQSWKQIVDQTSLYSALTRKN